MGFSIGKIFRSATKPIKKVLKSRIGKAALLGAGIYGLGGGQFFGGRTFPGVQPGGFSWKRMIPNLIGTEGSGGSRVGQNIGKYIPGNKGILGALRLTQGFGSKMPTALGVGTAAAAGSLALAPQLEEEVDVDVDSAIGDADYRRLAQYYEPEWEQWLLDEGYSAEDAARLARERVFSSQGGRIGLYKGSDRHAGTGSNDNTEADKANASRNGEGNQNWSPGVGGTQHIPTPPKPPKDEGNWFQRNIYDRRPYDINQRTKYINQNLGKFDINELAALGLVNIHDEDMPAGAFGDAMPAIGYTGTPKLGTQAGFDFLSDHGYKQHDFGGGGGEGILYQKPLQNVSAAVTEKPLDDGDYYGYQEWADWEGQPTTPMFGGTKYRDVLSSRGGRIGLYAGGMGAMNQGMNPMTMNQGIGSMNAMGMGSPRSQMMGQQQDPRMAKMNQMQNINRGIQSVKPPQQSEDAELIQLIKLLTSMGIPMEQLRGRTKEELVELVVSVKGKMQGERGVKETAEVIEEEDIREQNQAAGGGLMRTGYAMGSAPTDTVVEESENIELAGTDTPAEDLEDLQELRDSFFDVHGREPVSMDELKLFLRIRRQATNQGGLMRTGYAMGSEHPVIPSKDGQQLDMRDRGGYQPHGKAEKHDDVRALLAQGEFVMTSDAVKGMGGGDREAGAKKMYDLMHNMEAMA